jgi:hypothetical protein
MKDTQTQQCRTFAMALHLSRKNGGESSQMKRYVSRRLLTSRQLQVRTSTQVRPLLCYPLPAAPLS